MLRREPIAVRLLLRVVPAGPDGLRLLRLVNAGDIDASLPMRITLGSPCAASDGAGPYRLDRDAPVAVLERRQEALLRAHAAIVVGWTRCSAERVLAPP